MRQLQKMGSLGQLAEIMPGFSRVASRLSNEESERRLKKMEAIISSMTYEERHSPSILTGSRRNRIAKGSGTTLKDVNQVLNQFYQVQKLTKSLTRGKLPKNMMDMLGMRFK